MDSRLRGNKSYLKVSAKGNWIPAFAGMTGRCEGEGVRGEGRRWIPAYAGMTELDAGMTSGDGGDDGRLMGKG